MREAAAGNTSPRLAEVLAELAAKPDGVLEAVAERHGISFETVLACLPEGHAVRVSGVCFEEIWQELTEWGELMLIVHTRDGVFECKGRLPPGETRRGYFNIHASDTPISGHLRADRCRWIYFIDRLFFGKRSCSVQFISVDGHAMFKVFVARDADRSLNPEHLQRFEALRAAKTRPILA